MRSKRAIVLIAPLVQLFLLEAVFFWSQSRLIGFLPASSRFLYLTLIFLNVFLAFCVWFLLRIQPIRWLDKIGFMFWAWLLVNSIVLFSFLLPKNLGLHFLYFLASLILFYYLRLLSIGVVKTNGQYRPPIISFAVFSSVLIVFFLFSFFYGLESYLNVSVFRLCLAMVMSLLLIFYLIIRWSNADWSSGALYLLIDCLVLTEIAWAIFFLPFHFILIGAVFAFCFYIVSGLSRLALADKLSSQALKFYLSIGLGGLLLILLTAQWV